MSRRRPQQLLRRTATICAVMTLFACGPRGQAEESKTTSGVDRFGKRVEIPNPSHEDRRAALAPTYAKPADHKSECLGRLMFDTSEKMIVEWAVSSETSKNGSFDGLFQHFDDGAGKGRIQIETNQLNTVFAVYGPVTPKLREEFLNYREEMNAAALIGLSRALELQKETEDMYKRRPELLGPGIKEHVAEERARLEKELEDIKSGQHRKAIDLRRPNSAAFRADLKAAKPYFRGAIVLGKHIVAFQSMLRGFENYIEPTEDQWNIAESALRELVGKLQPRELYEIPKDRGFCLPYAFLRDDGTYGNKISTSFRFGDSPAVIYTLSVAAIPGGGASETTILNATGRSATGLLSHLPENTTVKQRLGPRPAKIGALTSEQGGIVVEAKRPGRPPREGYHVYTGYAGWAGSQILPTIEVVMESAARASYPKLTKDAPPYEQARPRLDALLKSIRLRPTTPPMPELVGIQ
ncbi:conserved hypothetical protein; putative exported protein [Cupriavidus taiwanensis]|nr:conserved hypothetical protein; putative exported protein [Cupriavidus taiwanensis]